MDRQRLLKRLDTAWRALKESYAGLSEAQLMEPGVSGVWSVGDIIAHVTTWEEEALKHSPASQCVLVLCMMMNRMGRQLRADVAAVETVKNSTTASPRRRGFRSQGDV